MDEYIATRCFGHPQGAVAKLFYLRGEFLGDRRRNKVQRACPYPYRPENFTNRFAQLTRPLFGFSPVLRNLKDAQLLIRHMSKAFRVMRRSMRSWGSRTVGWISN